MYRQILLTKSVTLNMRPIDNIVDIITSCLYFFLFSLFLLLLIFVASEVVLNSTMKLIHYCKINLKFHKI